MLLGSEELMEVYGSIEALMNGTFQIFLQILGKLSVETQCFFGLSFS